MAVDGVKFLVQLRKLAIRTMRTSTRSVRNHPFLVAAFLFVIFLYRSSPFLFSLLVSASPVLVCTAVLLGTLLSFGQPQIPEIERDEKISCEISSLRAVSAPNSTTVLQKEDVVFDRDDPEKDVYSVSRFGEGNVTPQISEEIVFDQRCVEEASAECRSREVEFTKGSDEETLAFEGKGFENERSAEGSVDGHMDEHFESESREVTLTFEGTPSSYEVQEKGFENDGSGEGSDDGHVDDHDRAESSSVPWTRVNGDRGGDDDDDDEDEASDSGSDGAESSSPDPSMADIIPLLDELHPLIECENSVPANLSRENSDLLSDRFHSSHVSSINSDEETDHKEAEEEEDGDDDDDEAEDREDKEDAEKPAITWTEDDQKNLMDLGTSELERNLRLESLIARRRSRRSMKLTTEKNLKDLDNFDLPFQVAPISTTRQNPFDFPNDSLDNMGLPPIPGSAPSTLMPRRNPFDIPYDSGEEKLDLVGDSFQQEFMHLNQKERVFRRHESFHIGSSSFEFPRQDARELNRASRFRPYFIPESSFMRQSSGSESSSFQRQISQLSGSSSFHRQTSGISEASSFQRQSSDVSESKASSAAETEPVSAEVDWEETKLGDHDSTEERVPDPEIDRASEHVEHGSQSSDNLDDQFEKRDFDFNIPEIRLGESETYTGTEFHQPEQGHSIEINIGSTGNDRDVDSWVSEARDLAASAGIIEGDMHLMASPFEDKNFSSSSSLSSEEHDDVKEADKGLDKGEEIGYHFVEKPEVQAESLFEASEFHHHHNLHLHPAERSPFETNLTLETIQEEHITSSSSSLASEEHSITEGLKLDETLMNMQHIRPDVDNNSDFPTEQALDSSNFSFSTDVEESHPKEPDYDLSPQASRINLSISSEELVDLESKDLVQERDGLLLKNDGDADASVHEEDAILSVIEEGHANADAAHSYSAQADLFVTANEGTDEPILGNEVTKEPILGNEDVLLSDENSVRSANLVDVPGNYEGKLISVAEEGDSLKDHCLIHPSPSDYEEEPFVIPAKHEEVSSANRLHSEDSEMNDLLNISSVAQELGPGPGPVNDFFDFGEPVEGRTGFEFESTVVRDFDGTSQFSGSFVPEVIMSDEMKELEEALLSELDAVGDFRVTELGMDLTENTLRVEEASGVTIPEAMFINKSELEAEKVVVDMDEFSDSRMQESTAWFQALESESVEKIEQPSGVNDEKTAPEALFINTFESKVQDAETGMVEFPESHVLESRTIFHAPEPEKNFENSSDVNAEIFGMSIHLRDELLVGGTEVVPMEDFESAIRTDEQIIFDGNISAEEIERSDVVAVDVSSRSHVSESNTVIENTEPATKMCESAPPMKEEIERPTVAATDVSLDPHVSENNTAIEEDEPAAEINESAPAMEEEIKRSAAPIDALVYSHVLESHAMIEEDELAAEMNKSAPVVEVIDVLPDSHVSKRNTVIEEYEPATEMNESTPAVEEEIEGFAAEAISVFSESHVSESYTVIEKNEPAAEMNESAPAVEEEIEGIAVETIDVLPESHISERNSVVEDEPAKEINETAPTMEEVIERTVVEAINVLSESRISERNSVVEDEPAEEMTETAPTMEEEIERSAVEAIDMLSDSRVSGSNNVIEEDESAAEMNVSAPAVEKEIKRSAVEAIDVLSGSHVSKSNTVIEKDESAADMNEYEPVVEEEIERPTVEVIDVLSDSHVSESNIVIEKDEPAAEEMNESTPAVEEEIDRSTVDAVDVLSDSCLSESNTVIEKDEPATETNELAPAIEEEIEGSGDADIDASSSFHVSSSDTAIDRDEPAVGDKSKDASEIENHQAESSPELPTSAQVSSSLQLESAESQALQKEDHQMGQTQLFARHPETSTETISLTEESDNHESSKATPEIPEKEQD